jgi:hypothetical protein
MNLKKLRTDRSAERDGVWKDWGSTGVRVRIARVSTVMYEMLRNQKMAAHAAELFEHIDAIKAAGDNMDLIPDAVRALYDQINAECLAELAVRDWEGIEWSDEDNPDDQPLECTQENAILVMTEVTDFRDWVLKETLDRENYVPRAAEALVGNSSASSGGKKTSGKSGRKSSKGSKRKAGHTQSQPTLSAP